MSSKKSPFPMTNEQAQMVSDMLLSGKRNTDPKSQNIPATEDAPLPDIPPVEAVSGAETAVNGEEITSRKSKGKRGQSHKEVFVQEVGITARYGKTVYIRKEFHQRIQTIVQTIGANEVSIYSYIDNVLSNHFNSYQEEISKEFDSSLRKPF